MQRSMKGWRLLTVCSYQPGLADTSNAFLMIAKNSSMTGQSIQIGEYFSRLVRLQPKLIVTDAGAFVR